MSDWKDNGTDGVSLGGAHSSERIFYRSLIDIDKEFVEVIP